MLNNAAFCEYQFYSNRKRVAICKNKFMYNKNTPIMKNLFPTTLFTLLFFLVNIQVSNAQLVSDNSNSTVGFFQEKLDVLKEAARKKAPQTSPRKGPTESPGDIRVENRLPRKGPQTQGEKSPRKRAPQTDRNDYPRTDYPRTENPRTDYPRTDYPRRDRQDYPQRRPRTSSQCDADCCQTSSSHSCDSHTKRGNGHGYGHQKAKGKGHHKHHKSGHKHNQNACQSSCCNGGYNDNYDYDDNYNGRKCKSKKNKRKGSCR